MSGNESSGAMFSPCRTWRYDLWRVWAPGRPRAMFIGLNPSTADETEDDPTIRRCIGFARGWGYGGICMLNLFAFRATQPQDLRAAPHPIGPGNDDRLLLRAGCSGIIIAAWGIHGVLQRRNRTVLKLFAKHDLWMHCLGVTKQGHPRHPLYLRRDTKAIPFTGDKP